MIDSILGRPPAALSPEQVEIWKELAPFAKDASDADRPAFECLVRLYSLVRNGDLERQRFSAAELEQLISLLEKFRMTPASRAE